MYTGSNVPLNFTHNPVNMVGRIAANVWHTSPIFLSPHINLLKRLPLFSLTLKLLLKQITSLGPLSLPLIEQKVARSTLRLVYLFLYSTVIYQILSAEFEMIL